MTIIHIYIYNYVCWALVNKSKKKNLIDYREFISEEICPSADTWISLSLLDSLKLLFFYARLYSDRFPRNKVMLASRKEIKSKHIVMCHESPFLCCTTLVSSDEREQKLNLKRNEFDQNRTIFDSFAVQRSVYTSTLALIVVFEDHTVLFTDRWRWLRSTTRSGLR